MISSIHAPTIDASGARNRLVTLAARLGGTGCRFGLVTTIAGMWALSARTGQPKETPMVGIIGCCAAT
jgi:hypothetical protein